MLSARAVLVLIPLLVACRRAPGVVAARALAAAVALPAAPIPPAPAAPAEPLDAAVVEQVLTLPCDANAAMAFLGDGGTRAPDGASLLPTLDRVRCLTTDGGVGYSIALAGDPATRRSMFAVAIAAGALRMLGNSAEGISVARALERDCLPPRGTPLGLYLRDPHAHANQQGAVDGIVQSAEDSDGTTTLRVLALTPLRAVDVLLMLPAPDDVYAGQRVRAMGVWAGPQEGDDIPLLYAERVRTL